MKKKQKTIPEPLFHLHNKCPMFRHSREACACEACARVGG